MTMRGMSLAIAAALAASERMMPLDMQPAPPRVDPVSKLYETRQDQRRAKRKAEKKARKAMRRAKR